MHIGLDGSNEILGDASLSLGLSFDVSGSGVNGAISLSVRWPIVQMQTVQWRAFLFLLAGLCAFGQPSSFEGREIVGIEFSPTDQPLPRTQLDQVLPIHVGEPLTMDAVRNAIP